MSKLSVNHLLGIKDLSEADIQLIFETADNFKAIINRPIKKVPSLRDITVANLFSKTLLEQEFHSSLPKKD
jgi:aspartate carbamoyltransferase catalytic subunit